jgi:hypothetical protein
LFGHVQPSPGNLVSLLNCVGVKIRNITFQNSNDWTCHLLGCSNVSVDHLIVHNPIHSPNTDGIDIDASQDVQIMNSEIYTGDDAIVLKNRSDKITYPHPCKNITVANCKLTSPTNTFKIGTETYGDFENIVFRDSVIQAGDPSDPLSAVAAKLMPPDIYGNGLGPEAGIALESMDGAHIRGVTINNIVMHGARSPIFIRLGDRGINPNGKLPKVPPGTIEDVTISDISADGASCASIIVGLPGHPVQGITISNLQVVNIGAGTSVLKALAVPEKGSSYPSALMWGPLPSHSLYLHHVAGVKLNNLNFANARPDTRTAVIADDVTGLMLEGLVLDPVASASPLIVLNDVSSSEIRGTIPQNTKTWVQVCGANSATINLLPNDSAIAQKNFELAGDVPTGAVTLH